MTTLTTDLKRLGEVKAPAGFADRLLAHVGMTDSYARFDTVLGAVYVAWNRQGISSAARDSSAEEFEARFRKEVGRPLLMTDTFAASQVPFLDMASNQIELGCRTRARGGRDALAIPGHIDSAQHRFKARVGIGHPDLGEQAVGESGGGVHLAQPLEVSRQSAHGRLLSAI